MRESKVSDRDKGRRQNNGEGTMSLWRGRVLSWKGRPLASSETVLESWCVARPARFIGPGLNRGVGGLRRTVIGRVEACESRPCPFGTAVVAGLGRAAPVW